MYEHDILDFRHEASRAKWRRELFRCQPPPFLGPLVTINEAAEALNRSISYVRNRIDDGRLNTWKDDTSKRVWILQDDVDLLKGDIRALEEKGLTRGGKRGPRKPKESREPEDVCEDEDLDASGGWEHPKPPPVIGGAAIEESIRESNLRYEQKLRENEEWYAMELAKLEGRDPEEAVRQLQIERGWIAPEPLDSAADSAANLESILPRAATPRKPRKQPPRPVSWSNPHRRPPKPVEPYVGPDDRPEGPESPCEIARAFPIGWIGRREAAAVLQVCTSHADELIRRHGLERRKHPTQRAILMDSVEVERLAERRLEEACRIANPGKRLNWWGSRRNPMELQAFDYWITTREAGQMLGVSATRIGRMCDRGLLPCKQEKPGVTGSRIYVPHCSVFKLSQREEYKRRHRLWEDSSRTSSCAMRSNEEWGIEEAHRSGPSKATQKNHGEYVTLRQAALILGVSAGAVTNLRERGRLPGLHLHPKRNGTAKNPWWFFRREDVDNLLADPAYRRNAARGKKAQYRS